MKAEIHIPYGWRLKRPEEKLEKRDKVLWLASMEWVTPIALGTPVGKATVIRCFRSKRKEDHNA